MDNVVAIIVGIVPAIIGGVVAIQIRRLDKKNSRQHQSGADDRALMEQRLNHMMTATADEIQNQRIAHTSELIQELRNQDLMRGAQVDGLHRHIGAIEERVLAFGERLAKQEDALEELHSGTLRAGRLIERIEDKIDTHLMDDKSNKKPT